MTDERDREIADLRRRLEDLERPKAETPPAPERPRVAAPRPKQSLRPVMLGGAGFFGLMIFIAVMVGRAGEPPITHDEDERPPEIAAPCNQAWAEGVFNAGQRTGLIRGTDLSRRDGLVVIVSSGMWNGLRFSEQQTLAAAIDCGISGPGKHLQAIRFRSNRSGEDLYATTAGDLLKLREAGMAQPR